MSYRASIDGPLVTVDTADKLERKIAEFSASVTTSTGPGGSIVDDAGWGAFVDQRFSGGAGGASGLSAGTRTFLSEFFKSIVRFEP